MANENNNISLIIKENYKQVEEVREINNETPTFEEFMNTYESDGNVNYADLNSWDISDVRGYGPVIMTDGAYRTPSPVKFNRCRYCKRSMAPTTYDYCSRSECKEKNRESTKKILGATLTVTNLVCPPLGAGLTAFSGVMGAGGYITGEVTNDRDLAEDGKAFLEPVLENIGGKIGEGIAKAIFKK